MGVALAVVAWIPARLALFAAPPAPCWYPGGSRAPWSPASGASSAAYPGPPAAAGKGQALVGGVGDRD